MVMERERNLLQSWASQCVIEVSNWGSNRAGDLSTDTETLWGAGADVTEREHEGG